MKYAIKADAAGTSVEVVEFNEKDSYNTIKEAIGGGWFDCVRIPKLDVEIWIDDEGKLVDSPNLNAFGTALWFIQHGMTDFIAGDIIVTGGVDAEGNTLGMTAEKVSEVIQAVADMSRTVLSDTTSVSNQLMENNKKFLLILMRNVLMYQQVLVNSL